MSPPGATLHHRLTAPSEPNAPSSTANIHLPTISSYYCDTRCTEAGRTHQEQLLPKRALANGDNFTHTESFGTIPSSDPTSTSHTSPGDLNLFYDERYRDAISYTFL